MGGEGAGGGVCGQAGGGVIFFFRAKIPTEIVWAARVKTLGASNWQVILVRNSCDFPG